MCQNIRSSAGGGYKHGDDCKQGQEAYEAFRLHTISIHPLLVVAAGPLASGVAAVGARVGAHARKHAERKKLGKEVAAAVTHKRNRGAGDGEHSDVDARVQQEVRAKVA